MPAGRPTLYRNTFPDEARRLALLGLTDVEVAEFFGVDAATLYRWDEAHPEFRETRARGKLAADAKVAESLYHRANGYEHEAVKIFMPAGAEKPVYAPFRERYPPDTQAATLWLSNRRGGSWKIKSNTEVDATLNVQQVISDKPLTEAEWLASTAAKPADV